MDDYLRRKYVGIYRVLAHYDIETNDFPRDANGEVDDSFGDFYLSGKGHSEITHYKSDKLQAYIPSIKGGNNILKQLDKSIPYDIVHTDQEVIFKFKDKDIQAVAEVMQIKTSGAKIQPLSKKNLPVDKSYLIPLENMGEYQAILDQLGKGNYLVLSRLTNDFLTSRVVKKAIKKDIKIDMRKEKLKAKEYIHKKGLWKEYITFLKKEINNG